MVRLARQCGSGGGGGGGGNGVVRAFSVLCDGETSCLARYHNPPHLVWREYLLALREHGGRWEHSSRVFQRETGGRPLGVVVRGRVSGHGGAGGPRARGDSTISAGPCVRVGPGARFQPPHLPNRRLWECATKGGTYVFRSTTKMETKKGGDRQRTVSKKRNRSEGTGPEEKPCPEEENGKPIYEPGALEEPEDY